MTLKNAGGNAKSARVLVVDDYEPWQRFITSALGEQPHLEILGHVFDGLEAVQEAKRLQPDLVLLDVGLPGLNGIQAAHRIRAVSPVSRILMVSQTRSAEIAEAAIDAGASGYVVKSDASRDLLPAINAVLDGKRFLSAGCQKP